MSVSGSPFAGMDGALFVNNTILNLEAWFVRGYANRIPDSDFNSPHFAKTKAGQKEMWAKGAGYWDALQNPMVDPPDLEPGGTVSLIMSLNRTPPYLYWLAPAFLVLDSSSQDLVQGRVDFAFEGVSIGVFYWPGAIGQSILAGQILDQFAVLMAKRDQGGQAVLQAGPLPGGQ